jgi:putative transcriptional regulator
MQTFLANQFLIAMPSMDDENFSRSVSVICQHNAEGASGIVINRLADITLGEVLAQMQLKPKHDEINFAPVFVGGPLGTDRGFVLHSAERSYSSTFAISDSLHLTTSRDIMVALAEGEGPEMALVALGFAGWSAGQLEQEMLDNSWLSGPIDPQVVFELPAETRWTAASQAIGVDVNRLTHYAGRA